MVILELRNRPVFILDASRLLKDEGEILWLCTMLAVGWRMAGSRGQFGVTHLSHCDAGRNWMVIVDKICEEELGDRERKGTEVLRERGGG